MSAPPIGTPSGARLLQAKLPSGVLSASARWNAVRDRVAAASEERHRADPSRDALAELPASTALLRDSYVADSWSCRWRGQAGQKSAHALHSDQLGMM